MSTRAEAKYRIVAEDKGSDAFKSFKRNVGAANETVEKFRGALRLGVIALGAGGFVSAMLDGIKKGSDFDATLAGAAASLRGLSAAAAEFQVNMARGVAPAIALASDELAKFIDKADKEAGKGAFWDRVLAAAAGGPSGPWKIPGVEEAVYDALRAKREEVEAWGEVLLDMKAQQALTERGVQLTDSVRTAQEKYNDAIGEYGWLLKNNAINFATYSRLVQSEWEKLYPKQEPVAEVIFKPVIEAAEEFQPYTDEWHRMLLESMTPSGEDIPAARSSWELFAGEIKAAATDAAGEMATAFTDAIFDVENAFDHLQRYAEGVFRAISAALINRYIAGPILGALGLGGSGRGSTSAYDAPIGPTLGGDPMGKALAGAGAGVTVQVNVSAIDTQTGMEFVARNARSIGAVVRREIERGRFRG